MHTATRLAGPVIAAARRVNPRRAIGAFGLYAPLNDGMAARPRRRRDLRRRVRGGADRLGQRRHGSKKPPSRKERRANPSQRLAARFLLRRALPRIHFLVPDRVGLPPLAKYAALQMPDGARRVGRLHRGEPRLQASVPALSDRAGLQRPVSRRAARGRARRHRGAGGGRRRSTSRSAIPTSSTVRPTRCGSSSALHAAHPGVTYDVTIKVEHLLKHRDLVPRLAATGCAFVTSAVESVDDEVLRLFDKGHTRADFVAAVALCRDAGVTLVPTFVAFHPVADAGVVLRSARHHRRARSGRSGGADSARDSAAGAERLAAAGPGGDARASRRLRCRRR